MQINHPRFTPNYVFMFMWACWFLYHWWWVTLAMAELEPLACHDLSSRCPSILYVPNTKVPSNFNEDDVLSLYNATHTIENFYNGYLLLVDCACYNLTPPNIQVYFAITTYTLTNLDAGSGLAQISKNYFDDLAWNQSVGEVPIVGHPLKIHLGCGCPPSSESYTSVISYTVKSGDSVGSIGDQFQSNIDIIGRFNNISNVSQIQGEQVLFIPSFITPSTIAKEPQPIKGSSKKGHYMSVGLAVGIGISLAIVLSLTVIAFHVITIKRRKRDEPLPAEQKNHAIGGGIAFGDVESTAPTTSRKGSSSSHNNSFLGSWNSFLNKRPGSINNNVKRAITLPGEAQDVFDSEKPIVFTYHEVEEACSNFLESRKLGEGAFGVVYSGHLRNQEVAIKKMKASKSKEFIAELRVLCKVHHSNLIELIGYAVGQEELYLVYEFAQHGNLSDHLHDPIGKGHQPLTWMGRVQIALDVARGLEYIHDHTRTHYVHRDVKTSNILLDGHFRGKVGDFGMAKLIEQASAEDENLTNQVVGTVGYLAPEYIRDGQVTSKSDVYAFGVVLMELITGLEALSKSKTADDVKALDQRSLVSLLYTIAYDGKLEFEDLEPFVDPNLRDNYPEKELYKVARLARQCVEEDSMARPDMREVVFKLARILLSSIEWEASLAGSSQIFSGLVQGR